VGKDLTKAKIYYDSERCEPSFTKLPASRNKYCYSNEWAGYFLNSGSLLNVPSLEAKNHYFSVETDYTAPITTSITFKPLDTIVYNTSITHDYQGGIFHPFYVQNTEKLFRLRIKYKSYDPNNGVKIYLDYEGCNRQGLNIIPMPGKTCLSKACISHIDCVVDVYLSNVKGVYFTVLTEYSGTVGIDLIGYEPSHGTTLQFLE